jgi:hypothetical protein
MVLMEVGLSEGERERSTSAMRRTVRRLHKHMTGSFAKGGDDASSEESSGEGSSEGEEDSEEELEAPAGAYEEVEAMMAEERVWEEEM